MDIILNNRYSLIEKIGGGGMADVYRAKDERLDRDVAIKILKEQFAEDEDFVKGFRRESHSIAKLNHPNIVSIYDVGMDTVDGIKKYYIVMELIEGFNLKDLIRNKGKLNVSDTISFVKEIAYGLKNAHENGIIHRDVKPQNILLQNNITPKVTDFGIAQGVSQATMTTNDDILGSVHYFSPEQASGKKTDEKSDIYSLGIVMFEMLTGKLPFDGDTPISVALKHIQEELPQPSVFNPNIPLMLDNIINKMTEKKPQDRYKNIDELLRDLNNIKFDDNENDTLIIPPEQRRELQNLDSSNKKVRTRSDDKKFKRPEKEHKENDKGKKILTTIMAILLAVIVATAGFYLFMSGFFNKSRNEDIEVPDIVGLNIEEGREVLKEKGLDISIIDTRQNPDYNPDDIIDQDPKSGTKVKEGYVIKVVINSIESLIEVEDYTGMDYETVKKLIRDTELILGDPIYEEVADEDLIGKIIAQDLRAGTNVEYGSVISFTVGKEIENKLVNVPNLIGESIEKAREILESNDLNLGQVSETETERFRDGTVMSQSVESGQEVEEGTAIDLTIVKKPEIIEETTPDADNNDYESGYSGSEEIKEAQLSFNLRGESDQEVELRIDRVQDGRRTELYRGMHPANDGKVIIDVNGKKGAVYEMYVNGEKKDTVEQW